MNVEYKRVGNSMHGSVPFKTVAVVTLDWGEALEIAHSAGHEWNDIQMEIWRRDIELRRAEYEWSGAPRGICTVCQMFYEENVEHEGKDDLGHVTKHRFTTKGDA